MMDARLKSSMPGIDFSNTIKCPKKCKQASPGDSEYYTDPCLNYQLI